MKKKEKFLGKTIAIKVAIRNLPGTTTAAAIPPIIFTIMICIGLGALLWMTLGSAITFFQLAIT